MNGGVWRAEVSGLAKNQIALAFRAGDPDVNSLDAKPSIQPQAGESLLIVTALGMDDSGDNGKPLFEVARLEGPKDRNGKPQFYDRLVINRRADAANFRVLLTPVRAGEPQPEISFSNNSATVNWSGKKDELNFNLDANQRTQISVSRNGKQILVSK